MILKGKRSPTTLVREIMEQNVIHVRPDQTVERCMALMTEKRVRHLPVLEGDKVMGIVSIGDLLKSIISKQKFVIDELDTANRQCCSARASLGLEFDPFNGEIRLRNPRLPAFLDEVIIRNLQLRQSSVDVRVWRRDDTVLLDTPRTDGDIRVSIVLTR